MMKIKEKEMKIYSQVQVALPLFVYLHRYSDDAFTADHGIARSNDRSHWASARFLESLHNISLSEFWRQSRKLP